MPKATIYVNTTAARKGRYIRASRARGMKLEDWMEEAAEAHMERQIAAQVCIPDGVSFSDLKLARDPDGAVSFDMAVIETICEASGIPAGLITDHPEDNASSLIVAWYQAHRADGGQPDPVAEELIAEAVAEDAAGQPYSHQPGRA